MDQLAVLHSELKQPARQGAVGDRTFMVRGIMSPYAVTLTFDVTFAAYR